MPSGDYTPGSPAGEPDNNPVLHLSDREYQVLTDIASGNSVIEIARNIFLSKNTFSTYRARVLAKLNSQNNAQLIRCTIKNKPNRLRILCPIEGVELISRADSPFPE